MAFSELANLNGFGWADASPIAVNLGTNPPSCLLTYKFVSFLKPGTAIQAEVTKK